MTILLLPQTGLRGHHVGRTDYVGRTSVLFVTTQQNDSKSAKRATRHSSNVILTQCTSGTRADFCDQNQTMPYISVPFDEALAN